MSKKQSQKGYVKKIGNHLMINAEMVKKQEQQIKAKKEQKKEQEINIDQQIKQNELENEIYPNSENDCDKTIDFNEEDDENEHNKKSDLWRLVKQQDDLENAFKIVLEYNDDIYLIRLMMQNENYLEKLTKETALKVTSRFLKIQKSQFVKILCLDFLQNTQKCGVFLCGNLKKINDIVEQYKS